MSSVQADIERFVRFYLDKSDEEISEEIVRIHAKGDDRVVDFLVQLLFSRRQLNF